MGQAIQERGDGRGVSGSLPSIVNRPIRCQRGGDAFSAPHDDLQEILGGAPRAWLSEAQAEDAGQSSRAAAAIATAIVQASGRLARVRKRTTQRVRVDAIMMLSKITQVTE